MACCMGEKGSHCTFCGHPYALPRAWPRTCPACHKVGFRNPAPVAVLLVPVALDSGLGLLLVRRGIPPHVGEFALPGGFIDIGESWQRAAAREVREEAGVVVDEPGIRVFAVHSAAEALLVFGLAPPLSAGELPPFVANRECRERVVATGPRSLAFPLHTEVMAAFFAGTGAAPDGPG